MNGKIDIEQIKNYNSQLKGYKEQSARLEAQLEYSKNDLLNLCKELSNELGREITPDNIEQVYDELVKSINSTLETGKAVLEQIKIQQRQTENSSQMLGLNRLNTEHGTQIDSSTQTVQNQGQPIVNSFFPNGVTQNQSIVQL